MKDMIEKNEMIFGARAVIEAIQAGKEIDKILVKKDIQSELSRELFAALKNTAVPVQRVPVERLNRITRKNHQGVIAFISPIVYQRTEDLVPFLFEQGKNPFFLMLHDSVSRTLKMRSAHETVRAANWASWLLPLPVSVSVAEPACFHIMPKW